MAKRSRVTARPGQLAPTRRNAAARPAARPAASASAPAPAAAARPSGSLTEIEEARAAELEAQILAEERAAEAARRRSRNKGRGGDLAATGGRGESLIVARTSQEYAYVLKDLRRITTVSLGLTGVLLALWIVFEVAGVGR